MKMLTPLRSLGVLTTITLAVSACDTKPTSKICLAPDIIGTFVTIPSGSFIKSISPEYPEEGQPRKVDVNGFDILVHEVTNQQFSAFVQQTEYITDAEKSQKQARDDAGSALFIRGSEQEDGRWALERDSTWRNPEGGSSSNAGREQHPVLHLSHNDASAYAKWAGGRLPTETEWEYAASLGIEDPDNSVSGAYDSNGKPIANTWQGIFPVIDSGKDGYRGTAPVGCYAASSIGLYDMIGNVWEWTDSIYAPRRHTIKGGSHLCANNFCKRYRPSARQPMETDFSSNHIGFRIVRDT